MTIGILSVVHGGSEGRPQDAIFDGGFLGADGGIFRSFPSVQPFLNYGKVACWEKRSMDFVLFNSGISVPEAGIVWFVIEIMIHTLGKLDLPYHLEYIDSVGNQLKITSSALMITY